MRNYCYPGESPPSRTPPKHHLTLHPLSPSTSPFLPPYLAACPFVSFLFIWRYLPKHQGFAIEISRRTGNYHPSRAPDQQPSYTNGNFHPPYLPHTTQQFFYLGWGESWGRIIVRPPSRNTGPIDLASKSSVVKMAPKLSECTIK